MACVDIDVDFYLDEASTHALKEEVARRVAAGKWQYDPQDFGGVEPWAPATLAADLRAAFYARDASRMETLLAVLEQKCDA